MPRILKQDAERLLANVPEEHVFWSCYGRLINSMRELKEALEEMLDDAYTYHARQEKNDFSEWMRYVVGDQKLARDLEKSQNRTQAANKVAERIDFLSAKLD